MTCPEACKNQISEVEKHVDGHQKTLFGSDGAGGIVGCVKKKVSYKQAIYAFLLLCSTFGFFFSYAWPAWTQMEKTSTLNTEKIESNEKVVNKILENQESFKKYLIDPKEFIRIIKEEFKDAIKEMKKG